MDTYNWGDLTEEEKLDVLHSWVKILTNDSSNLTK